MRRFLPSWLLWLLPFLFLAVFFFYPLTTILRLSFGRGEGLQPIFAALADSSLRGIVVFTFWQAALSTLITLALGLPAAYLLARFDFRGKGLLRIVSSIPFVLPTLVVAAAFNALLGPRGWANLALMNWFDLAAPPITFVNTFTAILVAHVFYNTTIVLRLVGDYWARLSPRLEQAARVLGASPLRAFVPLRCPASPRRWPPPRC